MFLQHFSPGVPKSSFATAITLLLSVLAGSALPETPSIITPAWEGKLGMLCVIVSDADPVGKDVKLTGKGIYVVAVAKNGPAHKAGLRRGDVILKIDPACFRPGESGTADVLRSEQSVSLSITGDNEQKLPTAEMTEDFAPRETPITIVVDAEGNGSYRSILGALSIAAHGDTLLVRPGVYREYVVIPSGVTLQADASVGASIDTPGESAVWIPPGVSKVTITGFSIGGARGVMVTGAKDVKIRHCRIVADGAERGNAIVATNTSALLVEGCLLTGKHCGIVLDATQAKVVDTTIVDSGTAIRARVKSRVELIHNFLDGNEDGILAFQSEVTARKNSVTGGVAKADKGIRLEDCQARLSENCIRRYTTGVVSYRGEGKFGDNTISQNKQGIVVLDGIADISDNVLLDHDIAAITVARNTLPSKKPPSKTPVKASIARNTLSATAKNALQLVDCEFQVEYNLFDRNDGGILVDRARGSIQNNTVVLNARGIQVNSGSRVSVYNNIVAMNGFGITVDATASWERGYNNVFGNCPANQYPLEDTNYVRRDRIRMADGNWLQALVSPAEDLRAETDFNLDPAFVRTGSDHRLLKSSALAGKSGKDGKRIGALDVGEPILASSFVMPRQWAGKIEFCDYDPADPHATKAIAAKVWRQSEKERILDILAFIQQKSPGLLERITMYRPLRLWRYSTRSLDAGTLAALASHPHCSIGISDAVFAANKLNEEKERTATLIHEAVHLADLCQRMSTGKAWRDLVVPRIVAVGEQLKKEKGLMLPEAASLRAANEYARTVARRNGLPTTYAAFDPCEAMAEYVAQWLVYGYSPPQDIQTYLRQNMLAAPPGPDPVLTEMHLATALIHRPSRTSSQLDEAIGHLDKAIQLDSDFSEPYALRAVAVSLRPTSSTMIERMITDLTQAIRLAPFQSIHYVRRAALHNQKGDRPKAIADLTASIQRTQLSRDLATAYLERGKTWFLMEEYDKALADFNESLRLVPDNPDAIVTRGRFWMDRRDYDKAVADLSRAIQNSMELEAAFRNRAICWEMKKEWDKALADYSEAIRISPKKGLYYNKRGQIHRQKGDMDRAKEDFSKAKEFGYQPKESKDR